MIDCSSYAILSAMVGSASYLLEELTSMNKTSTKIVERDKFGMTPENWRRLDAKTDAEITAAALSDPDAQPITPEQAATARRPALVKRIRHKLHMTRETFAAAYGIPLESLTAWERHTAEPTPTEMAYLRLIERAPELAKLAA
jgi:putative transcriptional regulator